MDMSIRSGGEILVDQLIVQGVTNAFCVPGESYLAVLDALYLKRKDISLYVARQDGGAAFMAEAYGKATGEVGICFVTRGPGATNASIGVHTAFQDSTPMILFVGQVGGDMVDREAFQEIDYRRMFGQMTKWVAQIDRVERIPEYVARAFQVASSGRPGPVVLALPEDMLVEKVRVEDSERVKRVTHQPSMQSMQEVRSLLELSERPLVILGGGGWSESARRQIEMFAEKNHLPVGCSFRRQDLFDNRHPNYIGDIGIGINPKLASIVKESDLLLVVGARLGEMTTGGYALIEAPTPKQKLIHIHPGIEELGRVFQASVMINSNIEEAAEALNLLEPSESVSTDWLNKANKTYIKNIIPLKKIYHGYQSKIITLNESILFKPNKTFLAGRYHSLKLKEPFKSLSLKITMRCIETNVAMAIEDTINNVYGFQFHPDSFLTVDGKFLIQKIIQA